MTGQGSFYKPRGAVTSPAEVLLWFPPGTPVTPAVQKQTLSWMSEMNWTIRSSSDFVPTLTGWELDGRLSGEWTSGINSNRRTDHVSSTGPPAVRVVLAAASAGGVRTQTFPRTDMLRAVDEPIVPWRTWRMLREHRHGWPRPLRSPAGHFLSATEPLTLLGGPQWPDGADVHSRLSGEQVKRVPLLEDRKFQGSWRNIPLSSVICESEWSPPASLTPTPHTRTHAHTADWSMVGLSSVVPTNTHDSPPRTSVTPLSWFIKVSKLWVHVHDCTTLYLSCCNEETFRYKMVKHGISVRNSITVQTDVHLIWIGILTSTLQTAGAFKPSPLTHELLT